MTIRWIGPRGHIWMRPASRVTWYHAPSPLRCSCGFVCKSKPDEPWKSEKELREQHEKEVGWDAQS